ncbi:MAG: OsmC family protein [Planctomycetota bacterium]
MSERVVTGMDLEKLETFRKALAEEPVILGLEVRSIWEGHSGRNTVHIGPYSLGGKRIDRDTRHYTMAYGAWKEVEEALGFEGPTDRVEPVEMALGAVAACVANAIGLNAPRNGIVLDELEVTVKADVDPSVLLEVKGPDAHTACIPNITCEVKAKGDLSDGQLETIQRLAHHSPVHGMVHDHNDMKTTVVRG